jgi:hypothetical protein
LTKRSTLAQAAVDGRIGNPALRIMEPFVTLGALFDVERLGILPPGEADASEN